MVVTNTASDSDIPVDPLGYRLIERACGGGDRHATGSSGGRRWSGRCPGTNTITTVVTDTNVFAVNAQELSATNSFVVTVNAVHNGPSLGVQDNVRTTS